MICLALGAAPAHGVIGGSSGAVAPAVGMLGDAPAGECIATQLNTRWLLTAAHCLGEGGRPRFLPLAGDRTPRATGEVVYAPDGSDAALVALQRARHGSAMAVSPPDGCAVPLPATVLTRAHDPATQGVTALYQVASVTLAPACSEPSLRVMESAGATFCKGDSGAPVVDADLRIRGVISQGFVAHADDRCSVDGGAVGRVVDITSSALASWITTVTERAPISAPVTALVRRRGHMGIQVILRSAQDWALPPIGTPVALMRASRPASRAATDPFDQVTLRGAWSPGARYRLRIGRGADARWSRAFEVPATGGRRIAVH